MKITCYLIVLITVLLGCRDGNLHYKCLIIPSKYEITKTPWNVGEVAVIKGDEFLLEVQDKDSSNDFLLHFNLKELNVKDEISPIKKININGFLRMQENDSFIVYNGFEYRNSFVKKVVVYDFNNKAVREIKNTECYAFCNRFKLYQEELDQVLVVDGVKRIITNNIINKKALHSICTGDDVLLLGYFDNISGDSISVRKVNLKAFNISTKRYKVPLRLAINKISFFNNVFFLSTSDLKIYKMDLNKDVVEEVLCQNVGQSFGEIYVKLGKGFVLLVNQERHSCWVKAFNLLTGKLLFQCEVEDVSISQDRSEFAILNKEGIIEVYNMYKVKIKELKIENIKSILSFSSKYFIFKNENGGIDMIADWKTNS